MIGNHTTKRLDRQACWPTRMACFNLAMKSGFFAAAPRELALLARSEQARRQPGPVKRGPEAITGAGEVMTHGDRI
jgi:hypothetical protein